MAGRKEISVKKMALGFKPKSRSDIQFQPSQNGCMLLDRKKGCIHSLNTTAAFVWLLCDGNHDLKAIELKLGKHWEESDAKLKKEVEGTIRKLKALKLIET